MKTLKDYDLQRGDWVKFINDGWLEFDKLNDFGQYLFHFGNYITNHEVSAVLRPSVIIRDILDSALYDLKEGHVTTPSIKPYFRLEIIHPKERKKSLKEKCSLNYPMDALDVFNTFHLLCEEIEELKKGDK